MILHNKLWDNNQIFVALAYPDSEEQKQLSRVAVTELDLDGRIKLEFNLPTHSWMGIRNGCALFFYYIPRGSIPLINEEMPSIGFCVNCRIIRRYIPNLITWTGDQHKVVLHMELECDVELGMPVED